MNILLTSVGRRCYLVEYFKDALGGNGRVVCVNSDPLTSGMAAADTQYTVPRVDSEDYIPCLLEICKKEEIRLMLSLFDIDLPVLAKHRGQFESLGVAVAVSDPWVVETANDKWLTYGLLLEHGLGTPMTCLGIEAAWQALRNGELVFPLIVKPRWGMGSIGIHVAEDPAELEFFYQYTRKNIIRSYLNILASNDIDNAIIIQQMVEGQEYGVDVLNDFSGNFLASVVKRKLAMRSGETDIAITENNDEVRKIAESIGSILRHRGNLDIDVMVEATTQIPYVIEFNVRFGGGYPFSHLAGVNFPSVLLRLANRLIIRKESLEYKVGVCGLKALSPRCI
ncbi:carbamoyl-phosphate synthase large subunit [Franzmannia pantelleriensis]|uniref:Carbamoyl-phosphate synthase large subunit n=1 Tax=Franzmannia pantelleriensis TaxID=48727 RepID=A0A1G9ES84_9GAMM|nr:ATP-grasp domain-containing protein [Halomonas pantelleriensis]SDK78923.1 carbamoyl-phosphate synthase large subunit [Halomonas pantelleriensis]